MIAIFQSSMDKTGLEYLQKDWVCLLCTHKFLWWSCTFFHWLYSLKVYSTRDLHNHTPHIFGQFLRQGEQTRISSSCNILQNTPDHFLHVCMIVFFWSPDKNWTPANGGPQTSVAWYLFLVQLFSTFRGGWYTVAIMHVGSNFIILKFGFSHLKPIWGCRHSTAHTTEYSVLIV